MHDLVPIIIMPTLFIGLPWLIFHYKTKWKAMGQITHDDEAMFEELYRIARRLNERMDTVERLVAQEDPHFRPAKPAAADHALGNQQEPSQPAAAPTSLAAPTRFTSLSENRSQQ